MEEPRTTAPRSVLHKILSGLLVVALLLVFAMVTFWDVARNWMETQSVHGPMDVMRVLTGVLFPGLNKRNDNSTTARGTEVLCTLHDPYTERLPAIRTQFGGRGTSVYAWPSSGGVWVHHQCYGVELDFLGLPRFEQSSTERDTDPEKEDAFCKRLEWIGGRYFKSEYAYWEHTIEGIGRSDLRRPWLGWPGAVPEDGVWVLWSKSDIESAEQGYGRIYNAHTMQERCEAIEMLGGKFYRKWEAVEVPPWSINPEDEEEEELLQLLNAEMAMYQ